MINKLPQTKSQRFSQVFKLQRRPVSLKAQVRETLLWKAGLLCAYKPAGFFLRLLAYFLEKSIFFLPASLMTYNLSGSTSIASLYAGIINLLAFIVFVLLLGTLYNLAMTYYFGGVLGKLITGLKVAGRSGGRLTFKRVLFRQLLSYRFSGLVFGLGYLAIFKDPEKRAWHDKTINSNVFIARPLYPFAILVLIFLIAANGYYLKSAAGRFQTGPLPAQFSNAANGYQQISKKLQDLNAVVVSPQIEAEGKNFYNFLQNNKYEEASQSAALMLQQSKTNNDQAFTYQSIGEYYLAKNDPQNAKIYYMKSLEFSTKYPLTYLGLAQASLDEKNYLDTIDYANKAANTDPSIADSYYYLGVAQYYLGDKNSAETNMEKAIRLNPSNAYYKSQLDNIKAGIKNPSPVSQSSIGSPTLQDTSTYATSWNNELSYINQDQQNIKNFLGNNSYDQGKLSQMNTLLNQRKAIATQIHNKMVSSQPLTAQDSQAIGTYNQLTTQYVTLANQVFPKQ